MNTLTAWNAIVNKNVCMGLTFGSTANTVSPTRPRDVEATPDSLIGRLSILKSCATMAGSAARLCTLYVALTFQKHPVSSGDKGPDVRRPVRVVQPASERKEAAEQLRQLAHQEEGPQ